MIPALKRQKQVHVSLPGQPGLESEFRDSQSYTEKPCLEKKNVLNLSPFSKAKACHLCIHGALCGHFILLSSDSGLLAFVSLKAD